MASCRIPSHWAFAEHDTKLLLHCGPLLSVRPNSGIIDLPFTEPQPLKVAARPKFLFLNDTMMFADGKGSRLLAFDLLTFGLRWELDLTSTKPYSVGPPSLFGTEVACYGRDVLNFIDPATGIITTSHRLPRIDKLFSPIPLGDDLLAGYTNWTVGGVVRYRPTNGKIVWQYRKSNRSNYSCIYLLEDLVISVRGETGIAGIDANNGMERWSCRADPWLYTELHLIQGNLLFGTAGRDGYIKMVDAATGREKWSKFLKNGCAHFDYYDDSVIVGDFNRCLYRLRLSDGKEIDRIDVGGQVVGDIRVYKASVYSVVWFSQDGKPPRLIRVDLAQ